MKYKKQTHQCCGEFETWAWDNEKIVCPKCGKEAKKVKKIKPQLHGIRTPTKNR